LITDKRGRGSSKTFAQNWPPPLSALA